MIPQSNDDAPITVDESDRAAARRALARNWPNLEESTTKYRALSESLAKFHHIVGTDSFALRYNLSPPRDRCETWTQQLMHGQITDVEFRESLKADAERSIDLEMLTAFADAYQEQLLHYSGVLQNAVAKPSEAGTEAWRAKERAIDDHVAVLRNKLPLWRENLETVFEFLDELRITSGAGLVKLGEFEATSAHWLAQLLITRMSEAWRSCREVSERSHRDPRYLYAARAIDLFSERWLATFPTPQNLSERLREEFILARAVVRRLAARNTATDSDPIAAVCDARLSMDNESRELELIGEMFTLVGRAGHIFRPTPNSDWGIDGEIEFKNSNGQASGRRLYVQLKAGNSYLVRRRHDDAEVFTARKLRHLEYWMQQAYPVMLVIRLSSGLIRWMDVSAYLRDNGHTKRQIIFTGDELTVAGIQALAQVE